MKTAMLLVACLTVLFPKGVATAQSQSPEPRQSVRQRMENPPALPVDYKLRPNDLIQIKVFQEEDLLTTTRVGMDSTIVFPLIGRIKIGGSSLATATKTIQDLLEKHLAKPQVAISLLEHAPQRFTILGQVQKPGTYECPVGQELTLLAAIGYAGGYTRIANPRNVTVKRNTAVFRLDARKMALEPEVKVFAIQPGDIITIGESLF